MQQRGCYESVFNRRIPRGSFEETLVVQVIPAMSGRRTTLSLQEPYRLAFIVYVPGKVVKAQIST